MDFEKLKINLEVNEEINELKYKIKGNKGRLSKKKRIYCWPSREKLGIFYFFSIENRNSSTLS